MMLMAAMVGALMGSITQSTWLGLFGGDSSAVLLAVLHAVLSIKYKINQIISGTVINIFSAGMTAFLSQKFLQTYQASQQPAHVHPGCDPRYWRISRVLDPIFFNTNFFVYLMFILLIVIQVALVLHPLGIAYAQSLVSIPKPLTRLGSMSSRPATWRSCWVAWLRVWPAHSLPWALSADLTKE